jgi:hypothetical protein
MPNWVLIEQSLRRSDRFSAQGNIRRLSHRISEKLECSSKPDFRCTHRHGNLFCRPPPCRRSLMTLEWELRRFLLSTLCPDVSLVETAALSTID